MKVAKQFHWEAAHRLPWHEGECRNLHGHSYRMWVELEGEPDERGMVMDFKHLKRVIKPLVDAWDHATLIADYDTVLLNLIRPTGWKYVVLPFDTTSENLCSYVADYLVSEAAVAFQELRIRSFVVRIAETETCYAEAARPLHVEPAVTNGLAVAART